MAPELPFSWGGVNEKWTRVWTGLREGGPRRSEMIREAFKSCSMASLRRHFESVIMPCWLDWSIRRSALPDPKEPLTERERILNVVCSSFNRDWWRKKGFYDACMSGKEDEPVS
jgi:hypothetical protein